MPYHLIFEGPELAGKSWIMSQIYNFLESKYHSSDIFLDGCHWFNCDLGIYGTDLGQKMVEDYLDIFIDLRGKNLLVEKFHISDIVYNAFYKNRDLDYNKIEDKLLDLGFKIVLVAFPEDEKVIAKRLKDRLNLYPHYSRIAKSTGEYIEQQRKYLEEATRTKLPYIIVETGNLPDEEPVQKILKWIGEE